MPDHELSASENVISLDGTLNTVGVVPSDYQTSNQTRTTCFSPSRLVEWAETVQEAYDGRVRLVFTPDRPMFATDPDADDSGLGIAVCPIVMPQDAEDDSDV